MIDRKNNITIIVTILCIIGIIAIIGYTYSFFAVEVTNAVTIKGDTASPSVSLVISRVAPTEDKRLVPQLDGVIHKAVIGTKGNCLDDNNNAVCQVYKITVTNTSTVAAYINGKIELDAKENPHLKWAIVSGLSNTTLISDIKTHEDTILTSSELYDGGETKEYYVVVWISETGIAQTDSGSFTGTVTFENIVTNSALATLTRLGITPENEILTTFTGISTDEDTGVYATEDDLGTSYYFRGNVTNNYVKFGKYTEDVWVAYDWEKSESTYGTSCTAEEYISCRQIASAGDDMYWRIVRINGDGTIRMIYDGTEVHANGTISLDKDIGSGGFARHYEDNAFVGYMNGTTDGTNFPSGGTNSTSYAEAHANTTNSSIKTTIDNWYQKYIETNYSQYIADAIYCNDRTMASEEVNTIFEITGEGFGTKFTVYSLYSRTNLSDAGDKESIVPTLKCPRTDDRFTTEPTIGTVTGNNKLTYPVALIEIDEVVFAGCYLGYKSKNKNSYLYNGYYKYWTLSPSHYLDVYSGVTVFSVHEGYIDEYFSVSSDNSVRPVLSLRATAITGGTGISTDPFTVVTE